MNNGEYKGMTPEVRRKAFEGTVTGLRAFKELKNKNGEPLKDIDYIELLGRKCIKADEESKNSRIPPKYGCDAEVAKFAKTCVEALDEGYTRDEISRYIANSINLGDN